MQAEADAGQDRPSMRPSVSALGRTEPDAENPHVRLCDAWGKTPPPTGPTVSLAYQKPISTQAMAASSRTDW